MATGLQSWSKTASSNASADANVNWAEGQAPSSVNDSARALMASAAMFRDDINGTIETGGTSTAYTVTSNQTFGSLAQGLMVAFIPHTTSGAEPTLAVDGLTAKPIRSAPGVELPSGVLSEGTPYVVTYYTSNSGEWILHGFYEIPGAAPIGSGMDYWGSTAPSSNYVFAYGQALSRTTYATLFARLGTTYGTGDGSTTFNVPDKRGRVTAGKDDMGGSSANRLTDQSGGLNGDTLGDTGGSETHTLTIAEMPSHNHGGSTGNNTAFPTANAPYGDDGSQAAAGTGRYGPASPLTPTYTHTHSISSQGSGSAHNNVQPTIIANYIIRVL